MRTILTPALLLALLFAPVGCDSGDDDKGGDTDTAAETDAASETGASTGDELATTGDTETTGEDKPGPVSTIAQPTPDPDPEEPEDIDNNCINDDQC